MMAAGTTALGFFLNLSQMGKKEMQTAASCPSDSTAPDTAERNATASGQPANFGLVVPGIYRSSYPKPENYEFLGRLGLKTVVTLVKRDELDHELQSFVHDKGMKNVIFNMKGTKKEPIPSATLRSILELVLNQENHPLLLHCNHGKHRTGCVVAAVRKLSGWRLDTVVDEYRMYAEPKVRDCDIEYINSLVCAPLQSLYTSFRQPARPIPSQIQTFVRLLFISVLVATFWLSPGWYLPVARHNTASR